MKENMISDYAEKAFRFIIEEMMVQIFVERASITHENVPSVLHYARSKMIDENLIDAAGGVEYILKDIDGTRSILLENNVNVERVLLTHSSIAMWAAIESLVENVLLYIITNNQSNIDAIFNSNNIKGNRNNKPRTILKNWEDSMVDEVMVARRYLKMLSFFIEGLSIEENHIIVMSEVAEGRNVVLHRMGIIDDLYLQKFPESKYKIGDKISFDKNQYQELFSGCGGLAGMLIAGDGRIKTNPQYR